MMMLSMMLRMVVILLTPLAPLTLQLRVGELMMGRTQSIMVATKQEFPRKIFIISFAL